MRALLECVWPGALQTCVVFVGDGADLTRTYRLGLARLASAVRREVLRRGRRRPCPRIVQQLFAALTDPVGARPPARRCGAGQLLLGDRLQTQRRLLDTQTRMSAVLDELRLIVFIAG